MTTIITGIMIVSFVLALAYENYRFECEQREREADGWIRF